MKPHEKKALLNRLSRAEGQLGGVRRMVEEGRETEAVSNQIKAVTHALDRARYAMFVSELHVALGDDALEADQQDHLEKLFWSLT